MKQCYPKFLIPAFVVLVLLPDYSLAQCSCGPGYTSTTEQHTISTTFSSNSTTHFKVPQFNATLGTLICVNAKVYLTSILRMRLENDETFPIDYSVKYQRKDTFSGPGIVPNVVGAKNQNYGPYSLDGSDGNPFAGPDFVSIGPDTIYNQKLYEATTANVVPYLGTDSIEFAYTSVVSTFAIGSDVYALAVTSTNRVDFVMSYTYCNTAVLALNIKNFQASLIDNDVSVSWTTQNEIKSNYYEIQVSENGKEFHSIGTRKSTIADGSSAEYDYKYHFNQPPADKVYVRIKQIDGKVTRYSQIKTLQHGDRRTASLNVYPNPVVRNINLQFDEPMYGDFSVELTNQVGQVVLRKQVKLNNSNTMEVQIEDRPAPGIYYLRATQAGSRKVYSGKLLFRR
ncbi:MAG: choice-of-anchor E domain-containing protein [Chitinophagaceae bacterium]|nr:MAG: choice-of-anchor E domain-containing protein [Chitinophagaceae bacterium]